MPALFDRGFRPFFLLAGLWAPVALLLWLTMLAGSLEPPTAMDPLAWHVHEMLFGFVAVAIAGFLLTAVPGWAGRPPLRGPPLAALAALWAAGRIAVALVARLARWRGLATAAEPLLWVLHLGYLWLPVGLALLAVSMLAPAVPQSVALHALTAGAMATMILAMMTRATLGHTGRPLTASRATAAIYLSVTAAAAARLASGLADDAGPVLLHASAAWVAAFALFVLVYGPMLLRGRPGPPA